MRWQPAQCALVHVSSSRRILWIPIGLLGKQPLISVLVTISALTRALNSRASNNDANADADALRYLHNRLRSLAALPGASALKLVVAAPTPREANLLASATNQVSAILA